MEVKIIEATPNPEETACMAARNDYMTEWIGDRSFEGVMESVEGDTIEEKKETLIKHLMRRGHYGPFEHPHATFSVKGVSRITMAQITRHRHATFDIQSLRYTEPKLGVTADENVRSLPPGNGDRRHAGCEYDVNQEK
ncbi:MAG: FAD-dependent thymidylate synthase, partial [Halobacteria archaeon]|nr:FAD-dependent thymidylate synthase [Halobacteria archaeon]